MSSAQQPTGIQDGLPLPARIIAERNGETWTGETKYDGWYNLSNGPKTRVVDGATYNIPGNTGYPSTFSSTNDWPTPIRSQLSGTNGTLATTPSPTRAGLDKTANGLNMGAYPAGDSIYSIAFSNEFNAKGASFAVTETNPVIDLASVVFQIELGSANGYDFYHPDIATGGTTPGNVTSLQAGGLDPLLGRAPGGPVIFPTLNLTFSDTTTLAIAANYAELVTKAENGTIPMPTGPGGELVEEPIYIHLYGFQWDLSEFENITEFSVDFTVVEHSQFYAAQLDQSDTFTQIIASPAAIPEPSAAVLLGSLGLIPLLRRRR